MDKGKQLRAIDFFCGAGGMTNGFIKAGINVIAGVDYDLTCKKTYEYNNKGAKFIHSDIKKLSFDEFEKQVAIERNDDNMIFIGCTPCQYWTIITTDKTKSHESKNLLEDFQRFVEYYRPGYIVLENVPGLLTKENESPLKKFLICIEKEGYVYDKAIVKAYEHGVPQKRKRFLLIASRVSKDISIPKPKTTKDLPTVRKFISESKGFPTLKAGHYDISKTLHTVAGLDDKNLLRLRKTPKDGGTRMSYYKDKELAVPCQYNNKSFHDTYGRMAWDEPAPTITTKFYSISNGRFAHPEQDRAISLREGATLQTFNKSYQFFGSSITEIARQIGNAVPPRLARTIAKQIIKNIRLTNSENINRVLKNHSAIAEQVSTKAYLTVFQNIINKNKPADKKIKLTE